MIKHRCDEDGGIPEPCKITFESISSSLDKLNDSLTRVHADVREVREQNIRLEGSQGSLWHILKEDIKPNLQALTNAVTAAVRVHAEECPARKRVMDAASTPSAHPAESNGGGATLKLPALKWVIYIGIIIGAAIASAIGTMTFMRPEVGKAPATHYRAPNQEGKGMKFIPPASFPRQQSHRI